MAALPTPRRTRNFRLTAADAERLRGSALDRFLRRLAVPQLAFVRPVAGVAVALGLTIAVVGAGLPQGAFVGISSGVPAAGAPTTNRGPVGGTTTENQATAAPTGAAPYPAMQSPATTQDDRANGGAGSATPPSAPSTPKEAAASFGTTDQNSPPASATMPAPQPTGAPAASQPSSTASDTAAFAGPTGTKAPIGQTAGSPTADTESQKTDVTRLLLIYGGVTLALIAFALLLLAFYARRRSEDPLLR